MRVTAIRVSDDLWRLLEREAAEVGVSVSQYMREAALARASAAAAGRGQDPFQLLAGHEGDTEQPAAEEPAVVRRRKARAAARDARSDSLAIRAESSQAARRRAELQDEVQRGVERLKRRDR